jgi:hypothetical protein
MSLLSYSESITVRGGDLHDIVLPDDMSYCEIELMFIIAGNDIPNSEEYRIVIGDNYLYPKLKTITDQQHLTLSLQKFNRSVFEFTDCNEKWHAELLITPVY